MDKKKISLIIPHKDSEDQLIKVLNHIRLWTLYPDEVLIIDSSKPRLEISGNFSNFCNENNIAQKILFGDDLFPGAARNIGIISASNNILAFLDVNTIASKDWLKSGLNILNSEGTEGVWGHTYYKAERHTEKIIRASSYGQKPIRTLPGSMFYKDVFFKCGLFIESVRAGEDGDWINRVILQELAVVSPKEELTYVGLSHLSYISVIKKWHRNYLSASRLPSLKAHQDLYFYVLAVFIVFAAFNWNWIMSNWDPNSLLYIPNVTKISISSIFFIYFSYRSIFLPLKKGITISFLFPINFLLIFFLSWVLDLNKTIAFAQAKLEQRVK